jgi:hypothetical protein
MGLKQLKLMKKILFFLLFPLSVLAQTLEPAEDSLENPELSTEVVEEGADASEEEYEYIRKPYTAPPIEPVELRNIPDDKWQKAIREMDYSKDVPKPPKAPKKEDPQAPEQNYDWTGMTQGLGTLLQILAVVFALGMIAYGIYWMMNTPSNKVLARDGTEITLANLDEYIHETDLQRFLREALEATNWPLAVRLYFLQTIKQLSEKEAIVWSKEKTNRDYLREMRNHPLGAPFRDVTRQYERVWYGNQPLTAAEFARLEPEFKALLSEI